jgi:two-component system, sensor histidine kinase and response regulator
MLQKTVIVFISCLLTNILYPESLFAGQVFSPEADPVAGSIAGEQVSHFSGTVLYYVLGFLLLPLTAGNVLLFRRYQRKKQANRVLLGQLEELKLQNEELKANNRNLLAADISLRESNKTKDKFFSIISHDLKGPLNSLTGLLQILIKYVDSFSKEELKEFAANMDRSVRNSLDLLDHLLQWSRTQTGHIDYRPHKLHLVEVVKDTVDLLHLAAANKEITLSVQVPEEIFVYADGNMLSFILRNLIFNAIKFTNRGGHVQISARGAAKMIEVSVADNGIGMNQQSLQKLFKIDSYHSTNGTANEMGTGLGLILCSEFVEKNGGNIRVDSTPGQGTTFHFTVQPAEAVRMMA